VQRLRRIPVLSGMSGSGPGDADRWGVPLGLIVLAIALAVDLLLGSSTVIVGTFLMAPFVCALFGSARGTALVAALAVCLGAASPLWTSDSGAAYVIRLLAIAISGGFAVAGAHARDRSRNNAARLRLLDAISEIADGSLPLAETLSRATKLIVPDAADMCMIDAVHEGRVVRAAVRVEGVAHAGEVEERLRRRSPSIPERFVTSEQAWMQIAHFRPRMDAEDLRRMAEGPEDLEFLQSLGPRSWIVAAMTARGRNLGTLTLVTAWSKRRYTADDVSFAQVLANRLGLALDNAGLFSDLESVERRLDTVMSMLNEAVTVHDAGGDLVYANDAAARWLGFTSPRDVLGASEQELLGRFEAWDANGTSLDRELIAQRFRQGRMPRREQVRISFKAAGENRWAVVSSEPINAPDGSLLYAVTTVEDVTELKRSEFAQQLLARAGELLGVSIDYQQMVQAVARVAVPQFADWCSVTGPDQHGMAQQLAASHSDPEKMALACELSARYPVRVEEATVLPEAIPGSSNRVIAVPMTAGAKIVGVLVFGNDPSSRAFDQSDLTIAVEIARRAGIAVENARLAGEQADVARVLQRGLRPARLPEMRGFEVATMYRPAGEVNEVGGDFYEAFEMEGGWMLAIGDVMGRGAAAASVTAMARYTIRTAGTLTGDPRSAARMLDQSLKQANDLWLCSAIVLVLPDSDEDPARASLLIAGHPLPLLVRGGKVNPVGQPGSLLGAPDEPNWEVTPLELSRGDQLVLYTDGVTEARGEGDRFGEDRLRASLSTVSDPSQMVAQIESALDSFLVGPPQDDAAMLVVLRPGTVQPAQPSGSAKRAAASTAGGE
jgi:PAS domain S-box-containing protein